MPSGPGDTSHAAKASPKQQSGQLAGLRRESQSRSDCQVRRIMKGPNAMIRHHLAGAAIGLALVFAAPGQAQVIAPPPAQAPAPPTDIPASHLQAAREVLVVTGVADSFESIYNEFRVRVRELVLSTRPELQKDTDEVIASLKSEADKKREEMIASASFIFAKHMNEADLKEIATFFKSPVGQRYNAVRPKALDEIFGLLQPWSVNTSNFLFDRFSAEMKKRGHQL